MKTSKQGLAVVQNLYLLQIDLQRYLESDLSDPSERREAKQRVQEFSSLLRQADWRYMGGEDVLLSLHDMEKEVRQKIVKKPASRPASRPVMQVASSKAKASKKKVIAKKKPAKAAPKKTAKKTAKKAASKKKSVAKKKK